MKMKKVITLCLALCLLVALLVFPAGAAQLEALQPSDGKYSITYGEATEGNEYLVLVVRGLPDENNNPPSINISDVNSILYIDQATGTENGVSFNNFIPKSVVNSTVFISGTGMDKPKAVATIEGVGVEVSGKVTLQSRGSSGNQGATITLTSNDNPSDDFVGKSNSDGSFTLDGIPEGTYTLTISMPGFLKYTVKTLIIENETEIPAINLFGGDLNTDSQVTGADVSALLGDYLKQASTASQFTTTSAIVIVICFLTSPFVEDVAVSANEPLAALVATLISLSLTVTLAKSESFVHVTSSLSITSPY